jgi:pimeloyl-ACP methyl ester carboxylesterase
MTRLGQMPDDIPAVEGIEHRFVEANGIRVHLAETGPPEAPAVLLLHSWPQHWFMWRRVMAALAGEYRLIAPDLRGFGWTEAPGHGYDGETFAADQVALLDALELERAHVVGHDWGGWTAMLLGILHAERVDRMVVCNAPHPWPRLSARVALESWRSWYTWMIATPGLGRRVLEHRWIARAILGRGNVASPFEEGELELYADSFRAPARADAIVQLYRYYQRAVREGIRVRWRGHRLTVPTLLLFGARDRYISARLLPGYESHADDMRLELVPDSGHFIVDEKPGLVAERARSWLAGAG